MNKYIFWGFILLVITPITSLKAVSLNSADLIKVPDHMIVNKIYNVSISLTNTGSSTWTKTNNYQLKLINRRNNPWKVQTLSLNPNDRISPGDSKIFTFNLSAPSRAGTYSFQWQMQHNGKLIDLPTENKKIVVETLQNQVKFISQVVPQTVSAGQSFNAIIQYKNVGNETWTQARHYSLGLLKPKTNLWGKKGIELASTTIVPPEQIATFRFTLVAPKQAGNYDFQWQMKQNRRGWFGETTPNLRITVTQQDASNAAEFVFQKIPGLKKLGEFYTILKPGEIYPVTLTFKNTSNIRWRADQFKLTAQNPANNMTWAVDQINLRPNDMIKPGSFKSFTFKIITPIKPGIYNFQWQMHNQHTGWFGEPSNNVAVTIK